MTKLFFKYNEAKSDVFTSSAFTWVITLTHCTFSTGEQSLQNNIFPFYRGF